MVGTAGVPVTVRATLQSPVIRSSPMGRICASLCSLPSPDSLSWTSPDCGTQLITKGGDLALQAHAPGRRRERELELERRKLLGDIAEPEEAQVPAVQGQPSRGGRGRSVEIGRRIETALDAQARHAAEGPEGKLLDGERGAEVGAVQRARARHAATGQMQRQILEPGIAATE